MARTRWDRHSLSHRTYNPGHFQRSCEFPAHSRTLPAGTDRSRPGGPRASGRAGGVERGGARRPPRPILGDAGMFTGLAGAAGGGEQVGAVAGARAVRQEPR